MMTVFHEENILVKFPLKHRDAIEIAICFPNTYTVGMASLGYQTAWKLFNQSEHLKVSRWFTDIQEKSNPQYIGFSFSWELDYKNIFSMLEKKGISLYAKDRKENDPIIFSGGQIINANPEPFCDNFDFFIIGDLETTIEPLINKIIGMENLKRNEKLHEISKLPGIYVPSITNKKIKREFSKNNLSYSSIITKNSIWPDTFLIEVARGCPELCKFCLASYGSLPFRTPDLKDNLIPIIDFGLKHTKKIGLLGASVSQHPHFTELIDYLLTKKDISVQIASVRADSISLDTALGLHKLGARSITMAVESGSERLRDLINKKVSNKTIINTIETIYKSGFNAIKLYGMVGLPFETSKDLELTIGFLKEIKLRNKTKKLVWSSSIFVPKAMTPFHTFGVDPKGEEKIQYLSKELHKIGVNFRAESYKWSLIQALISRGDRSINKILLEAYKEGSSLGAFNKIIKKYKSKINTDDFIFKTWDQGVITNV